MTVLPCWGEGMVISGASGVRQASQDSPRPG
jgi:hypothetical protein